MYQVKTSKENKILGLTSCLSRGFKMAEEFLCTKEFLDDVLEILCVATGERHTMCFDEIKIATKDYLMGKLIKCDFSKFLLEKIPDEFISVLFLEILRVSEEQ